MQQFIIPGRLDGLNAYTSACRSHRNAGGRMKRANTDQVSAAIQSTGIKPMQTPVNIHIDWMEAPNRGQMRDRDNIQFGVKFILDALVECRIIADDGFDYIGQITHNCYRASNDPRIIVTIEEVQHD